ncbi:DNA polymerase III subunit beta [Anaerobranca gottschalkii]|uniref:Beta sliding clamp n=1 Tax=Anaerobranca gottschalkii DSM 13577 TaxID=1120990 RepID=A0A1I0B3U1_9FIRM|nr:DNA polymerase III subunit beta [Anaerobranca gottschalkii]SET01391.1 DNA polymerase-3 subunit beta [Anaerobranca gottschalkii DSM 13577]
MEFYCSQENLLSAITITQRGISNKTTIPVLSGILLSLKGNNLTVKATDLEIAIECNLKVKGIVDGEIIIQAKIFSDIIRKLPKEEINFIVTEDKIVYIKSKSINIQITGQNSNEFPEFPKLPEKKVLSISECIFKSILKQTTISIATEEIRPVLTGVLFQIKNNTFNVVATDGHRLSYRVGIIEDEVVEEIKTIVPGKAVNELQRILVEDEDKNIDIYINKNIIFFVFDQIIFSTRVIEGKYPPYEQIIPRENKTLIKVNTKDFLSAIERAELLSREGSKSLVKFNVKDNKLNITSHNPNLGSSEESLEISKSGDDLIISFNAKLITDCLKVIESNEIIMEFNGSFNPCVIKPSTEDNFLYLVLPIRTA